MQIERRDDRRSRPQLAPDSPQNLTIRIGKISGYGGAVQSEQHAIDGSGGGDGVQHLAGELFEGFRR